MILDLYPCRLFKLRLPLELSICSVPGHQLHKTFLLRSVHAVPLTHWRSFQNGILFKSEDLSGLFMNGGRVYERGLAHTHFLALVCPNFCHRSHKLLAQLFCECFLAAVSDPGMWFMGCNEGSVGSGDVV